MLRWEIEKLRGTEDVWKDIEGKCQKLKDAREKHLTFKQTEQQIEAVLDSLAKLDFVILVDDLVEHLSNRLSVKELIITGQIEMPATWDMIHPTDVFKAIENITGRSYNSKIHRALAGMLLYRSVNATQDQNEPALIAGRPRLFHHSGILEKMGKEIAGPVSKKEVERKVRQSEANYIGGRHWLRVTNYFGGESVVLVFIIAGR